jgi:hypothetical protein
MRRRVKGLLAALATAALLLPASAMGTGQVFVLLWGQSFAYKPHSIRLSGDSTVFAQRLHWSSWGGKTAYGTGVAAFNTCRPDCAAAHFIRYPAKIVESRRRYCNSIRFHVYEVTTLIVIGRHNLDGYNSKQVLTVPCRGEARLS